MTKIELITLFCNVDDFCEKYKMGKNHNLNQNNPHHFHN